MTQDELKQAVAQAAADYVAQTAPAGSIIGVGTGSTANFFIDALLVWDSMLQASRRFRVLLLKRPPPPASLRADGLPDGLALSSPSSFSPTTAAAALSR